MFLAAREKREDRVASGWFVFQPHPEVRSPPSVYGLQNIDDLIFVKSRDRSNLLSPDSDTKTVETCLLVKVEAEG